MSGIITRRAVLTTGALGAGLVLSGCDKVAEQPGFRKILFSGEKMTVTMALYRAKDIDEAIALTNRIQAYQGQGHSCGTRRQRSGRRGENRKCLHGSRPRHGVHDCTEHCLGIKHRVGETAFYHLRFHQSSPRTMVKKSTFVAAVSARLLSSASAMAARSGATIFASTSSRLAGSCQSASAMAQSRAFSLSRPSA